ncbi:hypothetical protein C5S29_01595 [ANME-1 cluster archaeon GoMg3.2]|nr:hypothetical protein [ANME-1 cluster archaeon GoMg3.2]
MDKTLRTIREEIRKNREGIIPALTLVIDTNILADHAWARDDSVTHLIEEIVPDHPEFLIVVPHICKVEFKLITKEEVNAWTSLQQEIKKKSKDLERYKGFEELYKRLREDVEDLEVLINKLREAPTKEIEILSDLMLFFSESLPLQLEMSYYISKDPDYGLVFEDALVFSFVKLVGKTLDGESKVLFLTKDSDFDVKRVLDALGDENVEIYFNSGACLQMVKDFLNRK